MEHNFEKDKIRREIEIGRFEQRAKSNIKLHEYPQHLLTPEERIRVKDFLARNPEVLKEKEESKEEIDLEDLEGQVFDSKGRPEFDRDGLCIDYDD